MNKINSFPFHTFFLGIYFVLFVYVQNIFQVTFSTTYRSLTVCVILSLFIFGICYLIFKNIYKAGTFSTLLLLGLLTYGAFYNEFEKFYFKGLFPFTNIHRYTFALYCLLYIWLFASVLKSKSSFKISNRILNLFLFSVLVINFAEIIRFSILNKGPDKPIVNPYITYCRANGLIGSKNHSLKDLPDIYYIILDGYASGNTLKKYYNFDNSAFYDFLKSREFLVADSSKTYYPNTILSLAGSLNLNYIDTIKSEDRQQLITQNLLTYCLKQNNYRIVNVKSGYVVTRKFDFADETILLKGINEFERSLMQLSILRLDDILGISTYYTLKSVFDRMYLATNGNAPKFVFIHIVAPHPPYVFNQDGSFNLRQPTGYTSWEPRKDYLEQLIYVNKVVEKFVAKITSNPKRMPIVVLQSDHGPWIKDASELNVFAARRGILNAYLVPKDWRSSFESNTDPVNSFRIILNKLFNADFDCLPLQVPDRRSFLQGYAHK